MADTIKLSSPATREFWEIPVLVEDETLLALDKPAGLLTSPDRDDPARPNLITLLHSGIAEGKPWARSRNLHYLANAHRLDFECSGVMLFAKTKPALITLANFFGAEKPRQTCVALVQDAPSEDSFSVEARIAPHPGRPGMMRVDNEHGKRARTVFEVRERFAGWTLLQCRPATQRPHQIRAHLRHVQLPIAGDRIYGGYPLLLSQLKRSFRLKPGHDERPLLGAFSMHVEELAIEHPVTGAEIKITAPWPKDLTVAIKYLRRYAPSMPGGVPEAQR
ncbi:MAG: rRNA pseudouridine synthase [Verrucomicrobiota bacterium]